ncbi:PilZ domain-containing protein [Engelhardtia mirabilis]|uniref:PilZ domain protein n=1 Tax=Engelhardtia mirabilis TaxID=2528011 RepID=A0A518BNJ2_9BACT|nr:PilZ domain protein [Planctomycetes bacterium Pla133]QDV02870.1 PilZ domain protein [Planctomycetes bacterium Pla86]
MSLPRRKTLKPDRAEGELLNELSRQTQAEISKLRGQERQELRLDAELRPANLSAGVHTIAQGRTLDVSPGGCRMRLSAPPTVGDVYTVHLSMDGRALPRVHALCLRTALVGDAEVEAAFQFLSPLEDSELFAKRSPGSDDLLG